MASAALRLLEVDSDESFTEPRKRRRECTRSLKNGEEDDKMLLNNRFSLLDLSQVKQKIGDIPIKTKQMIENSMEPDRKEIKTVALKKERPPPIVLIDKNLTTTHEGQRYHKTCKFFVKINKESKKGFLMPPTNQAHAAVVEFLKIEKVAHYTYYARKDQVQRKRRILLKNIHYKI
nr:unnamed protein product [Callosobruchus chinensis]